MGKDSLNQTFTFLAVFKSTVKVFMNIYTRCSSVLNNKHHKFSHEKLHWVESAKV